MSIDFNLIEQKTFNHPIKKMCNALNLDFEKLANESSVIDEFKKINENVFEIKTKNKNILKKDLFLKTRLIYKVNMEKGLVHIISELTEDSNLFIDCKIRAIPTSDKETKLAVKLDANVDFGFSSLLNKGIKVFADKEIKKFLEETLSSFELKTA